MRTFLVEMTVTVSRVVEVKAECAEDAAVLAKEGQGSLHEECEFGEPEIDSVEEAED